MSEEGSIPTLYFSDQEEERHSSPLDDSDTDSSSGGVEGMFVGRRRRRMVEALSAMTANGANGRLADIAARLMEEGDTPLSGPTRFFCEVEMFDNDDCEDDSDQFVEQRQAISLSPNRNGGGGSSVETSTVHFVRLRAMVDEDIDRYYADGGGGAVSYVRGGATVRNCGLEAVNFVSGDVDFSDFSRLLCGIARSDSEGEQFVDLGCGSGNCLAAAALLSLSGGGRFVEVVGVELNLAKVVECSFLASRIATLGVDTGVSLPAVRVIRGNFLDPVEEEEKCVNWWERKSVVYACATCFTASMLGALSLRLDLLPTGSRVILMDKSLLPSVPGTAACDFESNVKVSSDFALMEQLTCTTSWGTAVANVFIKL